MKRFVMRWKNEVRRGWPTKRVMALLLPLCLAGCSSTGTVSGKVTYKGEALRQGIVQFVAADGWTSSAMINSDGTYRIANLPPGLFKLAVETHPGLAQGSRLTTGPGGGRWKLKGNTESKEGEEVRKPQQEVSGLLKLPAKYTKVDTSGLTCEVKAGRQEHNIDLQ